MVAANSFQLPNNSNSKAQPMESDAGDVRFMAGGVDESELDKVVPKCGLDFNEWTSLILETEKKYHDVIDKICLVYDFFLSEFPLCHGYWRRYAAHKARLCTVDTVVDVFERAVQSATYSVSIWVDYCSFSISSFEDPSDIRRLFRRAISFVGKDYLSYSLWDKYIEFELSQQQWDSLALIYIQTLRFPSKKLHCYYSSFQKLTASLKENIQSETGSNPSVPMEFEAFPDTETPFHFTDAEISSVIKDLLDLSIGIRRYGALQKYMRAGKKLYDEACQLEEKIIHFEVKMGRTYFHVRQLDESQLKNWHCYLDFIEMHGDFDWAVKLYERCLIPCANYPEFWMRYVDFMEVKGGRELAKFALKRATDTFLKRVPVIHLFNARFKEQLGDLSGARAAFLQLDVDLDSNFPENIILQANMEKRMGNFTAASNLYKEAVEMALMRKKLHVLPSLYIHFSQLKYAITASVEAAMEVLIDGIRNTPHCKLLFEELLKFLMMHGGQKRMNLVDSIVADAISLEPDVSHCWSEQDKEGISALYLKVVDLWGTIHDVKKAWNRHIKLFPHSFRAMSYEDPASGTVTLRMTKAGEQASLIMVPNQTIKDGDHVPSTQLPLEYSKHSLLEDQDFRDVQTAKCNEATSHSLRNSNIYVKEPSVDLIHSGEAVISAQNRVQQNSPKISEHSGEDGSGGELAQIPIDNSKEDESDHALGESLKNLSIGNLSLSPNDIDKNNAQPQISPEGEASLKTSMSNESVCNTSEGALMHNTTVLRSSGSVQIPIEMASPLSTASHDKPMHSQAPLQSQTSAIRNENWHHKLNAGNLCRDSEHQFHGDSQRKSQQKWQDSPRHYQGNTLGPHMQDSQDPSESIASQKLPVENCSQENNQIQTMPLPSAAQQQNFPPIPPSQFPPQGFTLEQSQYLTSNDKQCSDMQSGQASQTYEQMWQYYYYQQQQYYLWQQQQIQQSQFLQQQYHQQQLQVQQQNFQSQQLYPYQHLQVQQQYYSQQQQQQQQQVLQATYHQQHLHGLQQQVSEVGQQSLQQHKQPEELEEEQNQHKKLISSLPIQMQTVEHVQQDSWQDSGCYQSGAETALPNETSVVSALDHQMR